MSNETRNHLNVLLLCNSLSVDVLSELHGLSLGHNRAFAIFGGGGWAFVSQAGRALAHHSPHLHCFETGRTMLWLQRSLGVGVFVCVCKCVIPMGFV